MAKKDWVTASDGWPTDPTANPQCEHCKGHGILVTYPPPSGMCEVLAECYCILDRDEDSIRATEYLQREA